jgi:hypothetical protein
VRIVGELSGFADELGDTGGGPPTRAGFLVVVRSCLLQRRWENYSVLEILSLSTLAVSVWASTLNARAHGHGDSDALIEESGGQSRFAETRTASDTGLCGIDLGHLELDAVKDAVEAPSPCSQDAYNRCQFVIRCSKGDLGSPMSLPLYKVQNDPLLLLLSAATLV